MTSVDRLSASRSNKEAELIYERLAEILDNEQVSAHNADSHCSAD